MRALVGEAMRKAAVAWVELPGRRPYPLWCHWTGEVLLVVSGPGEQPAPGLAQAGAVSVTARGDHGGAIVTWIATVRRIRPGTEDWEVLVPQLAARRLNSDPAPTLLGRWAAECVVSL